MKDLKELEMYDVDALYDRIGTMSDSDIMAEYAYVCNIYDFLDSIGEDRSLSDSVVSYLEPICEARDYLGYCLAGRYMDENGWSWSSGNGFYRESAIAV